MGRCINCGVISKFVSYPLNICSACLRDQFDNVRAQVEHVHCKIRAEFGLPEYAPKQPDGIRCGICVHECRMGIGMRSYCGLRLNCENQLSGVSATQANVSWYFDRLPTNCVADWVCPGGTGCGYPDYAYVNGAEYGYKNLAVFYHACTFDCLFCQNWHYREQTFNQNYVTAEQLADVVDGRTACICYFGGDPTAQLPHAILVARLAQHKKRNRILRICWETNGSMNPELLGEMLELSLESGGCIKFDLKAWTESVHIGLCGTSNKRTLSNFALAAERVPERPIPPLVIASTLLIPGYVEIDEVSKLAQFIARLNPDIPYSLLAFHPEFYMTDLPPTSKKLAEDCKQAALHAGVNRVNIGNIHLLTG